MKSKRTFAKQTARALVLIALTMTKSTFATPGEETPS